MNKYKSQLTILHTSDIEFYCVTQAKVTAYWAWTGKQIKRS